MKTKPTLIVLFLIFSSCAILANTFFSNSIIAISKENNHNKYSLTTLKSSYYLNSKNFTSENQFIKSNIQTTDEDFKSMSIRYAKLNNAKKSVEYAEEYIKNFYEINFLNSEAFSNIFDSNEYRVLIKKYKPELNSWILFFFSIGIIGLFFSIIINLKKSNDVIANLLISFFVLFHSLFVIHLCLFLSKYNFKLPHSLYITTSFSFLYGPLMYFYFKRTKDKYKFKKQDLLHLIPSIILFIYLLPIYGLSKIEKLDLLYNRDEVLHSILETIVVLKIISMSIYVYLILKSYSPFNSLSKTSLSFFKWYKRLIILNILYVFSYTIYGIALMNIVMVNSFIYPQILSMTLIIIYISYTIYVKPEIFNNSENSIKDKQISKYKKSGLTETYSNELKSELLKLFDQDKIYKQSNLSLDLLSIKMSSTRHNISQVINEHFGVSFFHFVNKYRIEEALRILSSDTSTNLNIIDVAYDVGFNNKVTFNKAFKIKTSMTPTNYIKSIQAQDIAVKFKSNSLSV